MTATKVRRSASAAAAEAAAASAIRAEELRGLDLVARRPILSGPTEVLFRLRPGATAFKHVCS